MGYKAMQIEDSPYFKNKSNKDYKKARNKKQRQRLKEDAENVPEYKRYDGYIY